MSTSTSTQISSTSTLAPSKKEWLIILPDHADVLEKRQAARPGHLIGAKSQAEKGIFTFGGAFFDEHPGDGEAPKAKGSVILAHAESREELLEVLRADEYTKSGVWDMEKVQIFPFKTALRKGLEGEVGGVR